MLISLWMADVQGAGKNVGYNMELAFKTWFYIVLSLFVLQTFNVNAAKPSFLFRAKEKQIADIIKEEKLFDGADKIYTLEHFSAISLGIIPYFPNYTFIDVYGEKKYNMNSAKNINNRSFGEKNIDIIARTVDNTKKNILVALSPQDDILKGYEYNLYLKEIYSNAKVRFCAYRIYAKRKN